MQFTIVLSAFAAIAAAAAVEKASLEDRQLGGLCGGLGSTAVCCATDVLNILDLNCAYPEGDPANSAQFIQSCSTQGKSAHCCLLPVAGQGLVCTSVTE
ncbi:fungal hydrophobin-domain-containing protein [Xylariales sp. PMI_506]|nr:fungal hydrophobin-domain-containing protein [Xylariales sp. PMI_506]